MSNQTIKGSKESDVSVGAAALTMAVGIVIERLGRISSDDRKAVFRLVKALAGTSDPDETESIGEALREILEQERGGVRVMKSAQAPRSESLQKWINHAARRVAELRRAAGLTQDQLAQKSGLPQSHISRIESARLSPSRFTLEKIVKALGRPISDIDPTE